MLLEEGMIWLSFSLKKVHEIIPEYKFGKGMKVETLDMWVCVLSLLLDSLRSPWTIACKFLCPGKFSGKNTVMSCHFLPQESFPT